MSSKANKEREVLCPYCHNVFVIKSKWLTSEVMCGSCGQTIDMKKFETKDDPKSASSKRTKKQKLNNNSTRNWLHGRMAIVPTPKKNKLGGRKANRLPMLTGVKNVLDSDEEEEERLKKRKEREAARCKKKEKRANNRFRK